MVCLGRVHDWQKTGRSGRKKAEKERKKIEMETKCKSFFIFFYLSCLSFVVFFVVVVVYCSVCCRALFIDVGRVCESSQRENNKTKRNSVKNCATRACGDGDTMWKTHLHILNNTPQNGARAWARGGRELEESACSSQISLSLSCAGHAAYAKYLQKLHMKHE